MTIVDTSPRPSDRLMVRWRDILASEWIKLRSVRSTYWTLVIAALTAIGGSIVIALSEGTSKPPADPLASIFLGWLEYPVLAVGILGVLVFTSEYTTGQIRTTLTAVPQRLTVLGAKAVVVGLVTLVFGELVAFVSFLLSEAILSAHHRGLSLAEAGVLRAVLAAGLCLFAIAVVGVGLGAIVRHTAGAIAALPALVYLPLIAVSLPQPWNDRIGEFTLLGAAYQAVSLHPSRSRLPPAASVVVLIAWPAATVAVAALLIARRDT